MIHLPFNGLQPRQDLSKEEIVKQYDPENPAKAIDKWYLDCARYAASFYNRQTSPASINAVDNYSFSLWGTGTYGEADKAYRLSTLFQGNQGVDDYGWLTQVDGNDALPLPYNPGQEARRFIKFIANQYLKIAQNSKPVVKSYDVKSQSELKKKLKRAYLKYDMKPLFEELSEEFGIDYEPEGTAGATSKDQIEKFFYQTATTTAEINGTDLLNQIRAKNRAVFVAFQTFLHVIVSGRCMTECTKKHGWAVWDIIPPWCQFAATTEDDDFGRHMELGGWVREFTSTKIATQIGLFGEPWGEQIVRKYGRDALEKITKGNADNITKGINMNHYNFMWGRSQNGIDVSTWTVVRSYWKGLVDTRTLPHNEDPDNKLFFLSEKNKKKGTMVEVWKTATVINDQYVVDEGVCDEIVDPIDKGKIHSPLRMFQPYTMMGYNKSLIEEVEAIQKDMSMLDFKFREMVGYDFGIILEVLGAAVHGATDAYTLMEELKKVRILVKKESGDPGNPIDSQKVLGTLNMSTAAIAVQYLELWKRKEQMMKDTLNISDISLGTQSNYVGFQTQQESMQTASTPLQYHIYGHVQFMTDMMQYSLEQMKIMISSGETDAAESIIGKRGVLTIKEMKKNLFETLLCRVDVDDYIDEKRKAQFLNDLRILMQQPGQVDLMDLVEVESLQTWSEIRAYAKWKVETNKANAEGQQLLDKIMGLVGANNQMQTQQQMAELQAETVIAKQAMADDTKLAAKEMDVMAKMGAMPQGQPTQ